MKPISKFTALLLSTSLISSLAMTCSGYEASYSYDTTYDYSATYDTVYDESVFYDASAYVADETTTYEDSYITADTTAEDAYEDPFAFEEETQEEASETAEEIPAETETTSEEAETTSTETETTFPENWPIAPEISSPNAYLIDCKSGTVLYSKNDSELVEMSGTTKIMTALVALENSNLSDPVVVTATAVSAVNSESSNIAMVEGETLTVEDCISAMLLASANDAALQLAEQIGGGSVDHFVELMNAKAKELGCTNTTFFNPTGLSEEDGTSQMTTAKDLALITQAAFQNEDFLRLASASSYSIAANDFSEAREFRNNLTVLDSDSDYYYASCVGGREGYTSDANLNVACAAVQNDRLTVLVCLNSSDGSSDASRLFDYAFASFHSIKVADDVEIFLPSNISLEDLDVRSSQKLDGSYKNYYFNDRLVASIFIPHEKEEVSIAETPTPVVDHEDNLIAAEKLTSEKSVVPYYIIGAVSVALFLLLLYYLIKVITKKNN